MLWKLNYSLFTNDMQRFSGNIFATGCRSPMGVSPLVLELQLWHLIFLHLMTFLVTLTCDSTLILEMWAFLDQFEDIFTTTITKKKKHSHQNRSLDVLYWMQWACTRWVPTRCEQERMTTIPIGIPLVKLQNSGFSTFKEIHRKLLHIISELTIVHKWLESHVHLVSLFTHHAHPRDSSPNLLLHSFTPWHVTLPTDHLVNLFTHPHTYFYTLSLHYMLLCPMAI